MVMGALRARHTGRKGKWPSEREDWRRRSIGVICNDGRIAKVLDSGHPPEHRWFTISGVVQLGQIRLMLSYPLTETTLSFELHSHQIHYNVTIL
jgi:hypothetical protein